MNHSIIFFVSCVTFVLMFLIKIPVKKWADSRAIERAMDEEEEIRIRKHTNFIIIILVCLVALFVYYGVLVWLGEKHVKLCCAFKSAALSMAYYAVYEQITGENGHENAVDNNQN